MPVPIDITAAAIDLGQRFDRVTTIDASPALAAETIIATLTMNTDETITEGVELSGWAAYTVGTSGTAVTLRIRKTNVAGTLVASSGALTAAATNLRADTVRGVDTTPALTGQVYVLTMQVTSGAAASTVSALVFSGIAV